MVAHKRISELRFAVQRKRSLGQQQHSQAASKPIIRRTTHARHAKPRHARTWVCTHQTHPLRLRAGVPAVFALDVAVGNEPMRSTGAHQQRQH